MRGYSVGLSFGLLCLIASIMLAAQPYCCSAQNLDATGHDSPIPKHDKESQTQTTANEHTYWLYAALKNPEWWLAFIAALTGLAITIQVREMTRTTDAMLKNTDAFIKSQRAWVVTRIEWPKDGLKEGSTYDGAGKFIKHTLNIVLRCRNDGNTPAWILSQTIWLRTYIGGEAPPKSPETSDVGFTTHGFQPISIKRKVNTKASVDSFQEDRGGLLSGMITIIYAVVKYKDAFGEHETWCGYVVKGDPGHAWFERMTGYDEYNNYT